MSDSLGHKAMKGTVWATVDRIGNMCLQFGVNLVLARLLLPREFGAIGMLEIFIVVSQVLIDGGFAAALIQKKIRLRLIIPLFFYWNIFIAVILYGAIFLCAPFVAEFFNLPLLRNLLRVIGLILITNAFSLIQTNRLRKKLELNKLACANLCAYTISGILAVATAYFGFGVWSLVVLQLGYSTLLAVILWVITGWMPSAVFPANLCGNCSVLEAIFLLRHFYRKSARIFRGLLSESGSRPLQWVSILRLRNLTG